MLTLMPYPFAPVKNEYPPGRLKKLSGVPYDVPETAGRMEVGGQEKEMLPARNLARICQSRKKTKTKK